MHIPETVMRPYVNYNSMLYELLTRFTAVLDGLSSPADQHQETCPPPPPESDDNGECLLVGVHVLPRARASPEPLGGVSRLRKH